MRISTSITVLSAALTLGLGASADPSRADAPLDGAQLLDEQLAAAFVADDIDAAVALYAPDAVLFDIGGAPAVGPDQIRAALTGFVTTFDILEFHYDGAHYETTGNLSTGFAEFTAIVTPRGGGPTFPITGRSTTVARRIDGHWRYVHDHASLPAQ